MDGFQLCWGPELAQERIKTMPELVQGGGKDCTARAGKERKAGLGPCQEIPELMSFTGDKSQVINPLGIGMHPHWQCAGVALCACALLALASAWLLSKDNFLRKETSLSLKEISSAKENKKLV